MIPEYNADGTEKHIFCDGARFHVLSYSTNGVRCSEPKCEMNKGLDAIVGREARGKHNEDKPDRHDFEQRRAALF